MKPLERAHTFQINKTALAAPGIDCYMMLDALGAQLNLSAIVDGVLGDWTRHFKRLRNARLFGPKPTSSIDLYLISTTIRAGSCLKGTKAEKSLFCGYH